MQDELRAAGIETGVFDRITGEPTEASVAEAIEAATTGGWDGFVGIGGGSALDTAKLCALFATHGGGVYDYLNKPVGEGRQVPGPLLPLVALPTTSGTGSEVTTVAIVDVGVKSGISHRYLRPRIAIVDPLLSVSCPPGVTASVGLDALLHAVEGYTTLPYDRRPKLPPGERPPYQGAHPMADLLCAKAIELVGANLRRAVADGSDVDARSNMALAATIAGVGFGSAGVHIPHALSYPIASLRHAWSPPDYGGRRLRSSRLRGRRDSAGVVSLHRRRGLRPLPRGGPSDRRRRRPRRIVPEADARRRRAVDDLRSRLHPGGHTGDRRGRAEAAAPARERAEAR